MQLVFAQRLIGLAFELFHQGGFIGLPMLVTQSEVIVSMQCVFFEQCRVVGRAEVPEIAKVFQIGHADL